MGGQIKIDPAKVNNAVNGLQQATNSLGVGSPNVIRGRNQLQFVEKLNEIDAQFKQVLTRYQGLLGSSAQMTTQAVNDFEETDRDIASQIHLGG